MTALLLVLLVSPLDPLWSLVDEERYDDAIAGALHLARSPEQGESLRRGAMDLALNAACSGSAVRCGDVAQLVADWLPMWRPDSRAMPRLVEAVRSARLGQSGRLNRLPRVQRQNGQFCGPPETRELLLLSSNAGLSGQRRIAGACVALPTEGRAAVLAFNALLQPIAALGSPDAMVDVSERSPSQARNWALGAAAVGAAAAVGIAVVLFSDPGAGDLEVTVVRP